MSKPAEAEATLGLTKISRQSVKILEQSGLTVETLGFHRLATGSALISLETCQDVKQVLRESIMKDKGDDPIALSAKANALANIIKSEASLIKVISGVPQPAPEGSKRARKSFAAAAPPIDVKA